MPLLILPIHLGEFTADNNVPIPNRIATANAVPFAPVFPVSENSAIYGAVPLRRGHMVLPSHPAHSGKFAADDNLPIGLPPRGH